MSSSFTDSKRDVDSLRPQISLHTVEVAVATAHFFFFWLEAEEMFESAADAIGDKSEEIRLLRLELHAIKNEHIEEISDVQKTGNPLLAEAQAREIVNTIRKRYDRARVVLEGLSFLRE